MRVSGGHLCEAEAPTEAAAETVSAARLTEGLSDNCDLLIIFRLIIFFCIFDIKDADCHFTVVTCHLKSRKAKDTETSPLYSLFFSKAS